MFPNVNALICIDSHNLFVYLKTLVPTEFLLVRAYMATLYQLAFLEIVISNVIASMVFNYFNVMLIEKCLGLTSV